MNKKNEEEISKDTIKLEEISKEDVIEAARDWTRIHSTFTNIFCTPIVPQTVEFSGYQEGTKIMK